MKGHDGNHDVITLNAAIDAQAGWSALIVSLASSGRVQNGRGRTIRMRGGSGDRPLLTRILRAPGSYYFDDGRTRHQLSFSTPSTGDRTTSIPGPPSPGT
ncbi:hypothetical protein ABZ599_16560 [Streptomyces misionensis]|uniref:hypothetical protein n=1 Tax=Streptomyces misionensis TaxID=67331 RepID=UPI0033D5475B